MDNQHHAQSSNTGTGQWVIYVVIAVPVILALIIFSLGFANRKPREKAEDSRYEEPMAPRAGSNDVLGSPPAQSAVRSPIETIETISCQGAGAILAELSAKGSEGDSVVLHIPSRTCADMSPSPGGGSVTVTPYFVGMSTVKANESTNPWVLADSSLFTIANRTTEPKKFSCTYRPMPSSSKCDG